MLAGERYEKFKFQFHTHKRPWPADVKQEIFLSFLFMLKWGGEKFINAAGDRSRCLRLTTFFILHVFAWFCIHLSEPMWTNSRFLFSIKYVNSNYYSSSIWSTQQWPNNEIFRPYSHGFDIFHPSSSRISKNKSARRDYITIVFSRM